MEHSRDSIDTETKLKRIAWLSGSDSNKRFDQLIHHINKELLTACFYELDGRKAVGSDGIEKAQYGEDLEANLEDLVNRMKRMAYKPSPVREVLIPKAGKRNATRPLGISNFEDKLVQKAIQRILESIYEPIFLDCSFGFRPGRGCHDAIRSLQNHLYSNEVETVIDVDLANFFGTIDHQKLVDCLREKIGDRRLMRYLHRMFKAGVLAEGELRVTDEGVPQGSICSPILANVFAHYVIDDWFESTVKAHCKGRVEMFRYCDDLVICCQFEHDANRIHKALKNRLEKYNLRLNEEKTKLVKFTKASETQRSKSEVFHFLGFMFYWGLSRKGQVIPKLKTDSHRLRSKLKELNAWAKAVKNKYPLAMIWKTFCSKITGHTQYYGVSHNVASVMKYRYLAIRIMYKQLNRRSQKKSFNWEKFSMFIERFPVPKARVCHALF